MARKFYSPLRYPGGKTSLSIFLSDVIGFNKFENKTYCEMYAGGAGAALYLLFNNYCKDIILNDLDVHIYCFWDSVLNHNADLINLIENTSIDIQNWEVQKQIYENPEDYDTLEIGFSTFFLNRCNRSGILHKAGPIGGFEQKGNYKINARFNKGSLIKRIKNIYQLRERIQIERRESINLLKELLDDNERSFFFFLDPPYYKQGESLYYNFYKHPDHFLLSELMNRYPESKWLITYDNIQEIKKMYSRFRIAEYSMSYTLQTKKKAKEIIIFSDSLELPKEIQIYNTSKDLEFIN